MKTTVDIPAGLRKDVMRLSAAKTKQEAILYSMNELIRREKLKRVLDSFGLWNGVMTQDELVKQRASLL
jgi:hypothetical protein